MNINMWEDNLFTHLCIFFMKISLIKPGWKHSMNILIYTLNEIVDSRPSCSSWRIRTIPPELFVHPDSGPRRTTLWSAFHWGRTVSYLVKFTFYIQPVDFPLGLSPEEKQIVPWFQFIKNISESPGNKLLTSSICCIIAYNVRNTNWMIFLIINFIKIVEYFSPPSFLIFGQTIKILVFVCRNFKLDVPRVIHFLL